MITTSPARRAGRAGVPSVDQLDDAALALLTYDVALLDDAELTRATPCSGWHVADLIRHMNAQHDAMAASVHGIGELTDELADELADDDPRAQFANSAARWTLAMSSNVSEIRVPGIADPLAKEQVRAVHFVDMLVHRWDLAKALGRPVVTAPALIRAALPIAAFANAAGSPLAGSAYQPQFAASVTATPTERLVALLGRDPAWGQPTIRVDNTQ